MKIEFGKTLTNEELSLVNNIAHECNILPDTALLLFYRNIRDVKSARKFLTPDKKYFYDPFLLNGISEAVDKLTFAKEHNLKVLVFGDYDADGICATSVLYYCLKEFGIDAMFTVPEREEGYGLNINKIRQIKSQNGLDLVVTVDCGISDHEAIEALKLEGIDVIVTDHHEPPLVLPNCTCINPKIKGQKYPFDGLCGAGVAYKLSCALIGEKAQKQLDLVALATVADSMDLIDENRIIVYEGLKLFEEGKIRSAFKYIIGESTRQVNSQTLAYQVAPRVNAGGRMGDACCALKLFTSNDENEIFDVAVKLNEYNIQRQVECDTIYRQAKTKIVEEELYKDSVIFVCDEKWQTGFVGIVAARLVEEYSRPVIVFAGTDGHFKGSARSVNGINIFDAITDSKELLLTYGGHSQAAGVSVSYENYPLLKERMCQYVRNHTEEDAEKSVSVDFKIKSPITIKFAKEIQMLEPFGVGNKRPIFAIDLYAVNSKPIRQNSPHYSFNTKYLQMLDFNGEKNSRTLCLPTLKQVLFELNYSVFRGNESVKGVIKNVCLNLSNLDKISSMLYSEQLDLYLNCEEGLCIEKRYPLKKGYKTLYAVSNVNALKFNDIGLKVFLYETDLKNSENCIVVCPKYLPEGYEKIVYLDKPIFVPDFMCECIVNALEIGNLYKNELNTSRENLAEIYNYLLLMTGKKFNSETDFHQNNNVLFNEFDFVSACKIFFELGFFVKENGVLRKQNVEKTPLTESKIYAKISNIEEQ